MIAVLLATYNGAQYIRELITSLNNQTYKDFKLYIRDDGSTDQTINIIKEYASIYENIILMQDDTLHRGSMGSFMWLLRNIDADYYMFCDQDDVWINNKVEISYNEIQNIEDGKPALVCSDLIVVDKNLKVINPSFWEYMKLRPKLLIDLKYAVSCNLFTGCTMIINNKAKMLCYPLSMHAVMHDSWIGLNVIAKGGNIGYIEKSLILYRQHDNNVFGAHQIGVSIKYYVNKLKSMTYVYRNYRSNYLMAKSILNNLTLWQFLFYRLIYLIRR